MEYNLSIACERDLPNHISKSTSNTFTSPFKHFCITLQTLLHHPLNTFASHFKHFCITLQTLLHYTSTTFASHFKHLHHTSNTCITLQTLLHHTSNTFASPFKLFIIVCIFVFSEFLVVHNGIVTNYKDIKALLVSKSLID